MSDIKLKQSIVNLGNALKRLEEALNEKHPNPLYIDGTIQRFEFAIELFWKTLKRLLESEGILANTPKDVLKKAYAVHWIQNEAAWLQMLQDRNETSHIYDEAKAKQIYSHIKKHFSLLNTSYQLLLKKK